MRPSSQGSACAKIYKAFTCRLHQSSSLLRAPSRCRTACRNGASTTYHSASTLHALPQDKASRRIAAKHHRTRHKASSNAEGTKTFCTGTSMRGTEARNTVIFKTRYAMASKGCSRFVFHASRVRQRKGLGAIKMVEGSTTTLPTLVHRRCGSCFCVDTSCSSFRC
jgi:hypothetical protein